MTKYDIIHSIFKSQTSNSRDYKRKKKFSRMTVDMQSLYILQLRKLATKDKNVRRWCNALLRYYKLPTIFRDTINSIYTQLPQQLRTVDMLNYLCDNIKITI